MSLEPRRRGDAVPRPAAAPLSTRHLRAWIACFELALDVSHMAALAPRHVPDGRGRAPRGPGAAARRLLDAAARLPLALARAQAAGPEGNAARCFDDALAGMAELETHVAVCRRLQWLDAEAWLDQAALDDLDQRCRRLRCDLIALAAEARDAALQRLQPSRTRIPDA